MSVLHTLLEPGFLTSGPVHTALAVGGGAAVVCGIVGVFTVIRGQSFAGHALADVSSAGGSAAFLFGFSPLLGFLGLAAAAGAGLEAAGSRAVRGRDITTGVVLGAGMGLAALLLYLTTTGTTTSGAAIAVMFGSMFALARGTALLAGATGLVALAMVATLYRPLLLSALDPDLAAVRGVRVGLAGLGHTVVLALGVALAAVSVGAILATALLLGPAASALRLARRPSGALALAVLIGLGSTWLGILLAYDSAAWTPNRPWPVSFFIVALILTVHGLARLRRGAA